MDILANKKQIFLVILIGLLVAVCGCYKKADGKTGISPTLGELQGNEDINNPDRSLNIVCEAEDGIQSGTKVSDEGQGYSGIGFVTDFNSDKDYVEIECEVEKAGLYNIFIGYRSLHGDKTCSLGVNNQSSEDVVLKKTQEFTEHTAVKAMLKEGKNSIRIQSGWGWYDIDYLRITTAPSKSKSSVAKSLVNPDATKEAKALMSFLVDNYGKKIISGQQDFKYVEWIERNTGKKPALLGLDFIDYSPSRVEFGAVSDETQRAIKWWEDGGIVTFCWHWNAPKDLINTSGKEWWRGFYTKATKFDLAYALDNPGSEDYRLILRDIDVIAKELKTLQDAGVPVLWRPLHEAGGGWFWWGAKGPEACKELYILLYERLTHHHKLNNLIWVWSTPEPEWYPGDKYVDIIGYDSYPEQGGDSPLINAYDTLEELTRGQKLVALSENGPIPDPEQLQEYNAGWSWFCTWGDMINDGSTNKVGHIREVYSSEYVITLEDLPELAKYND